MANAMQKVAMNHRLSISSNACVAEAVERMKNSGEDAVIVFELGRVYGLFTEHDVFQNVVARGLDPNTTSIRSVMTGLPVTAPNSIQGRDALSALHEEGRSQSGAG